MPGTLYPPDSINRPVGKATHGETVLTAADERYQITSTATAVWGVWIGAPDTEHTVGAANTSEVFGQIASSKPSEAAMRSGSFFLETDDKRGFIIPVNDVSKLWFMGHTAGDAVEYAYLELI
jgi:hypothetical protein